MIALKLADTHHAHLLQDATTRVWDMRMLNRSLCLLRSSVGAVRSLRFSPCGSILAAAESVDFVRLYNVAADFGRCGCQLLRPWCVEARPLVRRGEAWSPVCVYASCVGCF